MSITKIGIISASGGSTRGGSEVSVSLLIEELASLGYEVNVISFPRNALNIHGKKNINLIEYNYSAFEEHHTILGMIYKVYLAMKQLESLGVQIIHVYNVIPIPGASLYKILKGRCPVVATLNNYAGVCPVGHFLCNNEKKNIWDCCQCNIKEYKGLKKYVGIPFIMIFPILKWFMQNLDGYIALSNPVKNIYTSRGYKEKKINVIPNFIENLVPKNKEEKEKTDNGKYNVLYIGRLDKTKGINILIEAFALLSLERPLSILTLIGDGPEKKALEDKVKALKIEDKVNIVRTVPHDEIWRQYELADVFVHPGLWSEPFPRTILEAMIAGVPCIVSDIGAPPEVVEDAGLIFSAGNVQELYRKLLYLNDNYTKRNSLRMACNRVAIKYQPNIIIKRIISFYSDTMKN